MEGYTLGSRVEPSINDICLTLPLLASTTKDWFIVCGAFKKQVLHAVRPSPKPVLHAVHAVAPPVVAS